MTNEEYENWQAKNLKDYQKRLEQYLYFYNKALETSKNEFKTKSAQKDCLDYINRAFEEVHWMLSNKLNNQRIEMIKQGKEQEAEQFWSTYILDIPSSPYSFNDKKLKLIQSLEDTDYELSLMIELKNLYNEVKGREIVKNTETPLEKKQKVYNAQLQRQDRSRITDEKAYNQAIDKIVISADKILTPRYIEQAEKWIEMSKWSEEQYQEQSKSFRAFYDTNIKGKSEEEIKAYWNGLKELELLDIRFKAMKTLNFDIDSIQLKDMGNMYKSWIINGNRLFSIEIIYAGGYNIQRLHTRCLVKLTSI